MENKVYAKVFSDTKPHYDILDGLRGVAALLVIWYHVFEGFAFAQGTSITWINHGYLAVDFFFMLSGFVLSYAYDDRWGKSLNLKNFFKRRLIRLHPMVIMGAIIGAVCFFIQGSVQWDGTHIATSMVMLSLLLSMFLIPAYPGAPYEVRGNGEMFPLNGPAWSLFFEYIGNIFYAFIIRKLSNRNLAIWTTILGLALAAFAIFDFSGEGFICVGWTLDSMNFLGGLLRMLFPFSLGMLLARNFKPVKIAGAFGICSLILILLFHVPFVTGLTTLNANGIFEIFCIAIVFPILIWLGASGETTTKLSTRICKFLGAISYPVYIIHYPIMYLFYSWLIKNQYYTLGETWPVAIGAMILCILIAYLCLKLYDLPLRKWLRNKFY